MTKKPLPHSNNVNTGRTARTRGRPPASPILADADPADTNPAEIGARIRAARVDRGWTQDQLAAAVGVSRSAVAQWETGRAGQITGNLTRIAAVLDTHVVQLMFGNDTESSLRPNSGDELAILRLYRACSPEDRQILLRMAKRLVNV